MAAGFLLNVIILCLFVYYCSGHTHDCNVNSCQKTNINCPDNEDCWIYCESSQSCMESIITGPISGELNVFCNADQSCFDAVFDGSKSSKISITGCTASNSCLDVSLYCPSSNSNTMTNCFIEGNNNLGDIKIYAINGWNDIKIDYFGTFGIDHGGKMFCGDKYDNSCNIASDNWSCININDCKPEIRPEYISNIPSNISSIYVLTEAPTASLTNANIYTSETIKSNNNNISSTIINVDESSEESGYEKKAKKGISGWPLMTRILFGVGALILIIIAGIGCYYSHKGKIPSSHPTHLKHGQHSLHSVHSIYGGHGQHSLHSVHSLHGQSTHSTHSLYGHHNNSSNNGHHHHGLRTEKQYSVTTTKDMDQMDHMDSCQMVSRTPTPTDTNIMNIHKDSDSLINNEYVHNNKQQEVIHFI